MKEADIKGMFKKASSSVCISTIVLSPISTIVLSPISTIVLSPDILSPSSSSSSTLKTPENTEEDPDDHEPVDEGDIHIEYSYA